MFNARSCPGAGFSYCFGGTSSPVPFGLDALAAKPALGKLHRQRGLRIKRSIRSNTCHQLPQPFDTAPQGLLNAREGESNTRGLTSSTRELEANTRGLHSLTQAADAQRPSVGQVHNDLILRWIGQCSVPRIFRANRPAGAPLVHLWPRTLPDGELQRRSRCRNVRSGLQTGSTYRYSPGNTTATLSARKGIAQPWRFFYACSGGVRA
jgi:hypothetical protein